MIRDFLIYGVGGAASRLAAIFLVPLYTRVLDVTDYGTLEVLLAVYTLGILLVGLQSESAILRDYYTARDEKTLPQLVWAGLLIAVAGTGVLVVVTAGAAMAGWVDPHLTQYAPLLLALTLLAQLFGIQLIILRFAGKPVRFALFSFLDVLAATVLSIVFMVVLGWGLWGALWGMSIAKAAGVALAWRYSFGTLPRPLPAQPLFARMLAYALPTMPSVLLNWLQTNGTRLLLALFLALNAVAVASVAIRVAALFGFVVYSFRLAWEPWAFQQLDLPNRAPDAYSRVLSAFTIAMLALAGVASMVSPLLVAIFAPPEYGAATALVASFMFGQLWIGIANITSIGIHGARVTSRLTAVFAVGGVLNVAVLAALADSVGIGAAAIAFLVSTIASAFAATWYSERHFDTGFSIRLLFSAAVVSCLYSATAWFVFSTLPALWAVSVLAGALALALVLMWYVAMTRAERVALSTMVRQGSGQFREVIARRRNSASENGRDIPPL